MSCAAGQREETTSSKLSLRGFVLSLRHRRVMFDDNLRVWIKPLQLTDELDAILRVSFRILRISEDDGKFGNDSKAANARGERQSIFRAQVFVHLLQDLVRA